MGQIDPGDRYKPYEPLILFISILKSVCYFIYIDITSFIYGLRNTDLSTEHHLSV